jgi:hypothetical protein
MIKRDERRTQRFELRLRPSELEAITVLARDNDRSAAAELRAALRAWLDLAPWMESVGQGDET